MGDDGDAAAREPVQCLRQLAAAARYAPPAKPPATPLLLLASAGDSLVSPHCSERLAEQWKLALRLHPNAGHDLPLDDPDWVVEQIVGWSRRGEGRVTKLP